MHISKHENVIQTFERSYLIDTDTKMTEMMQLTEKDYNYV